MFSRYPRGYWPSIARFDEALRSRSVQYPIGPEKDHPSYPRITEYQEAWYYFLNSEAPVPKSAVFGVWFNISTTPGQESRYVMGQLIIDTTVSPIFELENPKQISLARQTFYYRYLQCMRRLILGRSLRVVEELVSVRLEDLPQGNWIKREDWEAGWNQASEPSEKDIDTFCEAMKIGASGQFSVRSSGGQNTNGE